MGMQGECGFTIILLEIVAIGLDIAVGILVARKTAMTGRGYARTYYFGVSVFFFTHALYVFTSIMADLTNIVRVHDIGVFIVLSSMVMLVASIEHAMYARSRHLFTIIGCVALGIIMADVVCQFPIPIMRLMVWIQFFLNPMLVIFILLNYLAAARQAEGPAKKNAFFIVLSTSLFATGELSEFPFANDLVPGAVLVGQVLTVVAILMMYLGLMRLNIRHDRPSQRGIIMDIDPVIRILKDIWIIRREGTVLFHSMVEGRMDEQLFGSLMSATESIARIHGLSLDLDLILHHPARVYSKPDGQIALERFRSLAREIGVNA
ncbi:MAG: hypothetical protein GYA24_06550 [Candidatus Lokiarchaeota archaeon]|nr:hypothetical protein [Candidatus Lokiarchaeota archaeon]